MIVEVALPVPLRKCFDYTLTDVDIAHIQPGVRVEVPFGRQRLTGVVIKIKADSEVDVGKLRSLIRVLDEVPCINSTLLALLHWVSNYYHYPLGEVIKIALPDTYIPKSTDAIKTYQIILGLDHDQIRQQLTRSNKQMQLFEFLISTRSPADVQSMKQAKAYSYHALTQLVEKKIVESILVQPNWPKDQQIEPEPAPTLTAAQSGVLCALVEKSEKFTVTLLKGVTGSGKTEIYLRLAQLVLQKGLQVLILVPEISLTPQLVSRFEQRLGYKAAILHSALDDKSRRLAWLAALKGEAKVILGTRSAIFCSTEHLGLIILDEEHDMSYKQQEGVRYHARDVAIIRAKLDNIPILLGSATPSLESLANVTRNRFQLLELNERIGDAVLPKISLLSMDQLPQRQGLSTALINAIEKNLNNNEQTLIFINRRGFAPVVLCKSCGESCVCKRCNARLTYHSDQSMQCHHCGYRQLDDNRCQSCGSEALAKIGQGTQRIEETLQQLFPKANIKRLDRDAIRRKDQLEKVLNEVATKEIDILVGTQMLSKGHDFPAVTLVGVINSDNGLFGQDFHSTESMTQQLIQVSGRAGRADKPGKVIIQSHYPTHPLYEFVSRHAYMEFAQQELRLRHQCGFPPFNHLALIRASAMNEKAPMVFLKWIKVVADNLLAADSQIIVHDPVQSPMPKRNGRFRAQLLISSYSRGQRGRFLHEWIERFEHEKNTRRVRWSIDVDPLDLY